MRVLHKICKTKSSQAMTRAQCKGFKVYPPSDLYAIHWSRWQMFFEESALKKTLELTKDSIAIHVWNKLSIERKVRVGSKVAYGVIAEKYCPKVYHSCGEYF